MQRNNKRWIAGGACVLLALILLIIFKRGASIADGHRTDVNSQTSVEEAQRQNSDGQAQKETSAQGDRTTSVVNAKEKTGTANKDGDAPANGREGTTNADSDAAARGQTESTNKSGSDDTDGETDTSKNESDDAGKNKVDQNRSNDTSESAGLVQENRLELPEMTLDDSGHESAGDGKSVDTNADGEKTNETQNDNDIKDDESGNDNEVELPYVPFH